MFVLGWSLSGPNTDLQRVMAMSKVINNDERDRERQTDRHRERYLASRDEHQQLDTSVTSSMTTTVTSSSPRLYHPTTISQHIRASRHLHQQQWHSLSLLPYAVTSWDRVTSNVVEASSWRQMTSQNDSESRSYVRHLVVVSRPVCLSDRAWRARAASVTWKRHVRRHDAGDDVDYDVVRRHLTTNVVAQRRHHVSTSSHCPHAPVTATIDTWRIASIMAVTNNLFRPGGGGSRPFTFFLSPSFLLFPLSFRASKRPLKSS